MTNDTFLILWNNHKNSVYWEKTQVESGMKLYEEQKLTGNEMELGSTDDLTAEKEDGAASSKRTCSNRQNDHSKSNVYEYDDDDEEEHFGCGDDGDGDYDYLGGDNNDGGDHSDD
jgi:hypothetical protein